MSTKAVMTVFLGPNVMGSVFRPPITSPSMSPRSSTGDKENANTENMSPANSTVQDNIPIAAPPAMLDKNAPKATVVCFNMNLLFSCMGGVEYA